MDTPREIQEMKKNNFTECLTDDITDEQKMWWENLEVNNNSVDLGVTLEKGELLGN